MAHNIVKQDDVRPPGLAGSPLVLGDALILNGSSAVTALDARTGETLWKSGTSTVVTQHRCRWQSAAGPIWLSTHPGVDRVDITQQANLDHGATPAEGVHAPDPVVEGTKVFVTAGREFGGALFNVSGGSRSDEELWGAIGTQACS